MESRRLAAGNMSLKILVAAPLVVATAIFGADLSAGLEAVPPPVVAAVHTGFNVLVALVGLPALGLVAVIFRHVLPDPAPGAGNGGGPKFVSSGPIASTAMNARKIGPTTPSVNACTESMTPERVRNVPKMMSANVDITRAKFHACSIPRRRWTMAEWMNAVATNQGKNAAFSTGSHAQ